MICICKMSTRDRFKLNEKTRKAWKGSFLEKEEFGKLEMIDIESQCYIHCGINFFRRELWTCHNSYVFECISCAHYKCNWSLSAYKKGPFGIIHDDGGNITHLY